jgi:hypothetical protein
MVMLSKKPSKESHLIYLENYLSLKYYISKEKLMDLSLYIKIF